MTEARIISAGKDADEQEAIKKIFSRILEMEKEPNYIAPHERYMRHYYLNGYYPANDEDKLPLVRDIKI